MNIPSNTAADHLRKKSAEKSEGRGTGRTANIRHRTKIKNPPEIIRGGNEFGCGGRIYSRPYDYCLDITRRGRGAGQNGVHVLDPETLPHRIDPQNTFYPFIGLRASAYSHASSLSFSAIPSSSATPTISAPLASASGYISGRNPGVNMKLRRGRMFELSVFGLFLTLFMY
jgi:hypothetical protein